MDSMRNVVEKDSSEILAAPIECGACMATNGGRSVNHATKNGTQVVVNQRNTSIQY
jgi:hypothetical protein